MIICDAAEEFERSFSATHLGVWDAAAVCSV